VMKSGVCVEGVTPEMLCLFCEDFLISGTCCLRLRRLVERNLMTGTHMQEGLIFQVRPVPVSFTEWRYINWWSSKTCLLFWSSFFSPCLAWNQFMNCRVQPVNSQDKMN
jgi:hypothetical protein